MTGIPQQVAIGPGRVSGEIAAPPSKSVMQRVLALLLLRNGSLVIRNPGRGADDETLLAILKAAGFSIGQSETSLTIAAPGAQSLTSVNFGDSGLAARMLLPILATRREQIELDASSQLRGRGFGSLITVLKNAGASLETDDSGWPTSIQGPINATELSVDGSFSSQPVTGLLYALAAGADESVLNVQNAASAPYIDLSLQVMDELGFPLPEYSGYQSFRFQAGRRLKPIPSFYTIEGDWSAAAFWLVAGAIAGPLRVTGLNAFTAQADKRVLEALMDAGAGLSIESEQITVRPATLQAFHFNAADSPDLFPALAVLGCFAGGQSVIEGVSRLVNKESNRAETIISELGKLGADIRLQDDLMIIRATPLNGGTIDSHADHRIAMMAAIAALRASGPVVIKGAAAVAKSYPAFFEDLKGLGGAVNVL
jgi:3-phosphoshikimate 1-carboxyvinyltransferase